MAIEHKFMNVHICTWQESSMGNHWLLLLKCQQLHTIFTSPLRVKIIKHLCIFYVFTWLFLLLYKCPISENGLKHYILTFFSIYSHLSLMSIFTHSPRWGFLEAKPERGILMQATYWRSVLEETCKDMKTQNTVGVKQSIAVVSVEV